MVLRARSDARAIARRRLEVITIISDKAFLGRVIELGRPAADVTVLPYFASRQPILRGASVPSACSQGTAFERIQDV
jgi:hypothetical protein